MLKLRVLILTAALLLVKPVFAQTALDIPQQRFLQYVQQTYSVNLVNCSIQSASDQNIASEIVFPNGTPTATQNSIITDATTNAAVWGGWTPLPVPDYAGFRHDVLTNASAQGFPLALLCAFLVSDSSLSYSDRKTLATACATWITATYPAQATAIINQLKAYALARNLPLT